MARKKKSVLLKNTAIQNIQRQNTFGYFGIYIPPKFNNQLQEIPTYFQLPLFKYIDNNQRAQYNFNVNYGDNNLWYKVKIQNDFQSFWVNNPNSYFYNYPVTIETFFTDLQKNIDGKLPEQRTDFNDQSLTLMRILDQNFYADYLNNIIHMYKKSGNYIITISGSVDTFYVTNQDLITNKYLTDIYSIDHLNFKTFNHSFCNAYSLKTLPNETIPANITNTNNMFYLNSNYCNNITFIPTGFIIPSTVTNAVSMFQNCFNNSNYINVTSGLFPQYNGSTNVDVSRMFYNCGSLSGYVPTSFIYALSTYSNIKSDYCFYGCNNLNNYDDIPSGQKGGQSSIISLDFDAIQKQWKKILDL